MKFSGVNLYQSFLEFISHSKRSTSGIGAERSVSTSSYTQQVTTWRTAEQPGDDNGRSHYVVSSHRLLSEDHNFSTSGRHSLPQQVPCDRELLFPWVFNPLTAELGKYLRATLPDETFNGDFASWTVHFVNMCVKNQQMQQLFIQFINYVW
jgi:hypothetical protein